MRFKSGDLNQRLRGGRPCASGEVEYQTPVYAPGSKLLLLRTYFEPGEDMALALLTGSFRIYLRRLRLISREVKQQYMNMLRFAKKKAANRGDLRQAGNFNN